MVFSEKFEEIPIFHFQNGQLIMTLGKRLQGESWLTVLEIVQLYFDFILTQKKSQNLRKFKTRIFTFAQLVLSLSPIRISSTNTDAKAFFHENTKIVNDNRQLSESFYCTYVVPMNLLKMLPVNRGENNKNTLTQVYLGKGDHGCLIEITFIVVNE